MKKFLIHLSNIISTHEIIYADTEEEASEKIKQMLKNDNIDDFNCIDEGWEIEFISEIQDKKNKLS
jgi:hypothetical protein